MNLLTGNSAPRQFTPARAEAAKDDAIIKQAGAFLGEHLLLGLSHATEQVKAKAKADQERADAEAAARAQVEERLAAMEAGRAQDNEAAQRAIQAHEAAMREMQERIAATNAAAEALRADLESKNAEAVQLREAQARATEEYTKALEEAKAAAANAAEPRLIYQPPAKPEAIDFEYHRAVNGLLSRVVLKAEGYEDVAIDIVRGADNRMKDLKIGGKKP